jgi:hypothetical protein
MLRSDRFRDDVHVVADALESAGWLTIGEDAELIGPA